ncbi:hypothetical protein ES703_33500 [subsurface metagenome]
MDHVRVVLRLRVIFTVQVDCHVHILSVGRYCHRGVVPLIVGHSSVGLDIATSGFIAQPVIVDAEFRPVTIAATAPANNLTVATGLDPRSYGESLRAKNALVAVNSHVIIAVKLQGIAVNPGYPLRVAVERTITVITGGVKHITIKLPPGDRCRVDCMGHARQNQAQHQNKRT